MPYCRKCGAQHYEDAKFCQNCGTPVQESPVTPPPSEYRTPPQRREHKPYRLPTAILIVILLVATLSVITLVPFIPVDSMQSRAVPQANVNRVNLDFDADVADVNVFIREQPDQLVSVDVIAMGSVGIFASNPPIKFTFTNETADQNMTVTGRVSRQEIWPMSLNLKVTCNIYIDYSAVLNLNIRTNVGDITMDEVAAPVIFQGLKLHATTGNVEANITSPITITHDVSVSTTTGNVIFRWDEPQLSGSMAINLRSTTGRVNAEVKQNELFPGNVSLSAQTTTGDVDLDMDISEDVGAQIISQTTTGQITLDVDRFDGAQSPIRSRNYPAPSNFEVTLGTTTGNIHIAASHHVSSAAAQQETSDIAEIYAQPLPP